MEDLEGETERRTLTYSRWENQAKGKGREGWHPVTYAFADATLEAVKNIQVRSPLPNQKISSSSPLESP
jgi:hypothetical protein